MEPSPESDEQSERFPDVILYRLIAIERERVESTNRRTEIARLAIEKNDAADVRQYQYQMARLETDAQNERRRIQWIFRLLIAVASFVGLIVSFLLAMAFFGSGEQQEMALSILIVVAIAVGGYGVIGGIVAGARRMIGS